ncbi:hypothetical protein AALO_G00009890 [Alosa alosa]|uniref:UAP56-interacting factor n=1 Tax=Alosa alosa TaxID=278164 RepID=A0AAV6HJC9_9TELE|nr:UAP56-interacting factor-like [Alosa alosa]KAG5286002.1 hypothetical protein AALO_G00009890 [Alosa alosa]
MDFKARPRGFSEEPDKIDMSLDDIIRLNKKQRQTSRKAATKHKVSAKGRLSQGRRKGSLPVGPNQRGGVAKFGIRGHKVSLPVKRRRGQGVITGLAARKSATLFKGISPLNRPAADQLPQKSRPFVYEGQRRRMNIQRWPYRQADAPKPPHTLSRRPIQLRRTAPPIHQAQREARQATFLHRRGLKVQASVQKSAAAPVVHRTRSWRTSTTNSGILTVCIDNPSARTQPEPARAWSLHPQSSPAPVNVEKEPERKPPKGVSLQFDINSVGKQTAMTLNERFRILKERRTTAAAQSTKGSRYVTVG